MSNVAALTLAVLAGLYAAALGALYGFQRHLIYPAPRAPAPPVDAYAGFREVRLTTSDGKSLRALHRPAVAKLPTFLFFHGNGDSLEGSITATRLLAEAGYGLLLPEYRGYGGNPGKPSEAGLYADGRAAFAWLISHGVRPEKIIVIGNSLGSGVATQMAIEQPGADLVLVSGFTSLADVAARHMQFFPVKSLVRDRYDNGAKLGRVQGRILLLHGSADTLIPASHAQTLRRLAPKAALVIVKGAGHELAYRPESQAAILRWIASSDS